MSFNVRSSIISQAALIRRILRSRCILDHSDLTIEAIEVIQVRQQAKSVGAVSVSTPAGCSRRCELDAEIPGARFITVSRQFFRATAIGCASAWSELSSTRFHDLPPKLSKNASSRSDIPQMGAAKASPGH